MEVQFDTILKVLFQGIFLLALTVFFLNWLGQKLKAYWSLWGGRETEQNASEVPIVNERYTQERSQKVDRLQQIADEKSQDYKERILVPREEWKRKKKEEEFRRFLGPARQGEGHELGGEREDDRASCSSQTENRRAADLRRTLKQSNPENCAVVEAAKPKQKRVIQLAPEPPEDAADAITIKLRTPLGTTCCRRFRQQDTIQSVLDYITTQGFSPRVYNISTSFPRQVLDNTQQTLADLGLGKKLALNVEEKE